MKILLGAVRECGADAVWAGLSKFVYLSGEYRSAVLTDRKSTRCVGRLRVSD